MKQHLGLNAHRLADNESIQRWMWLCALAYWQLLLMGREVEGLSPAWYPLKNNRKPGWFTPGQVQRGAERFLAKLGTPAAAPRPSGKGSGRPAGYRPTPRKRYDVVRKGKKAQKKATPPAYSSA